MEPEILSPKHAAQSLDCLSDPEEQEISEEDDDDRNHKHRRREARSQSTERYDSDQVHTRTYRKPNKNIENGHSFREHERRRLGAVPGQRTPYDSSQRIRSNQIYTGDTGAGRGRGRDYIPWNQRDSRFGSLDISSQMVPLGPMGPGLFGGRSMSGVSTAQNAPWPAFGMLPGVPNGGLDPLHPMGLQGTLRPNIGIPRQRCRDFEERGFCLRGDMCPMEHGINRIVVEDVQSLSQFNLPVSLPSAQIMTAPAGTLPSIGAASAYAGAKAVNSRGSKPGMMHDYNDAYPGVSGTDFYDPDQPLWNNNAAETSAMVTALGPLGIEENEPMIENDHHGIDNDHVIKNTKISGQSVWGRIGGPKSGSDANGKLDMTLGLSDSLETKAKDDKVASASNQGTFRQGKRTFMEDGSQHVVESSSKMHNDAIRITRKPFQKALRTLYICGIPKDCNRKEALLSHFNKFGKVIDIRFPSSSSERAFIQFSKPEEAEAALMAPDAVMGNRFIKLFWANRDSIYDAGSNGGNDISATSRAAVFAQSQFPVSIKAKDSFLSVASKSPTVHTPQVPSSSLDHSKPPVGNGPKAPAPQQKKSESLEQLKEELRKKQEMLEQKRHAFRKQLAKLEKQTSGVKGELANEQASKRLKISSSGSSDSGRAASPNVEVHCDKSLRVENPVSESPKPNRESSSLEQVNLKAEVNTVAATNAHVTNRYKLDNRPTTLRVTPPLPSGLADVDKLKEHFSYFGGVINVELEDKRTCDDENISDIVQGCGARVTFVTRAAAEKAFIGGRSWHGQSLQLVWATINKGSNAGSTKENSVAEVRRSSATDNHITETLLSEEAAPLRQEETVKSMRETIVEISELQDISQPAEWASNPGENGAESSGVQDIDEASPASDPGVKESSEENVQR